MKAPDFNFEPLLWMAGAMAGMVAGLFACLVAWLFTPLDWWTFMVPLVGGFIGGQCAVKYVN